jgi:solute carrier family 5 (sodium/myo-inositol cotransporter), member 3
MYKHNRSNVQGYFLAGRSMIWLFVGSSLFASNIGSEHFIGLAGSGAASGYSVGAFELNAMIVIQLLGWVFLPVFISSAVSTLPEYMNKRFGGKRIRVYLSVLSLVLYIFTKISVNLYSGALFIKLALNWNLYYSVFFILGITAFCTIGGGLAAVIYTDTLQAGIMIIGGIILMIASFNKIGGFSGLYEQYLQAIPEYTLNANSNDSYAKCGIPNENAFTMLRGITDPDMPWLGFLLGQTPASIWYWCSDQMMVQRTLAAKNLSHAQGGTLFAGYIKILPFFMMVIPGMISRILFKEQIACADPQTCYEVCESRAGCSNLAYPLLIINLMPSGLRGIMLAVMLAALMSDLTSIFNSASTLFTIDIYQ